MPRFVSINRRSSSISNDLRSDVCGRVLRPLRRCSAILAGSEVATDTRWVMATSGFTTRRRTRAPSQSGSHSPPANVASGANSASAATNLAFALCRESIPECESRNRAKPPCRSPVTGRTWPNLNFALRGPSSLTTDPTQLPPTTATCPNPSAAIAWTGWNVWRRQQIFAAPVPQPMCSSPVGSTTPNDRERLPA